MSESATIKLLFFKLADKHSPARDRIPQIDLQLTVKSYPKAVRFHEAVGMALRDGAVHFCGTLREQAEKHNHGCSYDPEAVLREVLDFHNQQAIQRVNEDGTERP